MQLSMPHYMYTKKSLAALRKIGKVQEVTTGTVTVINADNTTSEQEVQGTVYITVTFPEGTTLTQRGTTDVYTCPNGQRFSLWSEGLYLESAGA